VTALRTSCRREALCGAGAWRREFRDRSFSPKWGCKRGRREATFCPPRPSSAHVDRARSREWIFPHVCHISCPIRAATPKVSEQYFFWSGESKTESAAEDWQRALKGAFKEAGIPDGRAHRLRDTFAVGLLQAGVPMDRVSALLGHSSIKVTEKHYSPWVRARHEQLEADVRRRLALRSLSRPAFSYNWCIMRAG